MMETDGQVDGRTDGQTDVGDENNLQRKRSRVKNELK